MTLPPDLQQLHDAAAQQQPTQGPASGRTAVTIHDGLVVLHFEKPAEFAAYAPLGALSDGAKMMLLAAEADPQVAQKVIELSLAMVDHVYAARGDLKPVGGAAKHELQERHRRTLLARVRNILATFREQRKVDHAALSKTIVDAMMREVFS